MIEKIKFSNINDEKLFEFDAFDSISANLDDGDVKFNTPVLSYNFSYEKGRLRNGYGIKNLSMPTSATDLDSETDIVVYGNEVRALWSFAWNEAQFHEIKYYIFYFDDNQTFYYSNLFNTRPIPFSLKSYFTSTPVGINYRIDRADYMVFSSADCDTFLFGNNEKVQLQDAPRLASLCVHDDLLFAITAITRKSLVYSDNLNIKEWNNDTCQHLDFSDERGELTKVISFGDYLYVFREFGITKVSTYSTSKEFAVSHIYQSSSFIFPGSIASDGENIFFMTNDGFYSFNGSTVKRLDLGNLVIEDNSKCNAICFESKYFLATRIKFDDQPQGCELEEGYINNALIIYNIKDKKVEILRGVDIKQLLALNNPYKCKVVMCFNGANIGKIGELVFSGNVFGDKTHKLWSGPMTDFGLGEGVKKLEHITIKTNCKCKITLKSDRKVKTIEVLPSEKIQHLKVGLIGRRFKTTIETDEENAEISNFKIGVR